MPNVSLPYTEKIANMDSLKLLKAMSDTQWNRAPENLRTVKDINGANEEMDRLGDIGITIEFEEVKILKTSEAIAEWFGAKGEFYVITTATDGSGSPFEYKTQYFQGIGRDSLLPLGDGGMLVSFMKNPKWFLDIHMLVMECDSDIRRLGEAIGEAKEKAKLDDIMNFIGTAAAFDPTIISQAVTGVNMFLTILSGILKANGDDHIATIHDFYLKHQAFGKGRHPQVGRKKFQEVEVAYNIELTQL